MHQMMEHKIYKAVISRTKGWVDRSTVIWRHLSTPLTTMGRSIREYKKTIALGGELDQIGLTASYRIQKPMYVHCFQVHIKYFQR